MEGLLTTTGTSVWRHTVPPPSLNWMVWMRTSNRQFIQRGLILLYLKFFAGHSRVRDYYLFWIWNAPNSAFKTVHGTSYMSSSFAYRVRSLFLFDIMFSRLSSLVNLGGERMQRLLFKDHELFFRALAPRLYFANRSSCVNFLILKVFWSTCKWMLTKIPLSSLNWS